MFWEHYKSRDNFELTLSLLVECLFAGKTPQWWGWWQMRHFANCWNEHKCERLSGSYWLIISDVCVCGVAVAAVMTCSSLSACRSGLWHTRAFACLRERLCECTRVYLHSVILLVRGQQHWGDCQQWKSIKTWCWQSVSKHFDLLRISQQTLQERIPSEWERLKNETSHLYQDLLYTPPMGSKTVEL